MGKKTKASYHNFGTKDQDQFLGEKLVLKNLQKETEGTYVCVERDKHGHEIAYKRELQIVQQEEYLTQS